MAKKIKDIEKGAGNTARIFSIDDYYNSEEGDQGTNSNMFLTPSELKTNSHPDMLSSE